MLDFLATRAERGHADIEHLVTPADLAAWAVEAGIVDGRPQVDEAALKAAKDLREAMFRLVQALIDDTAADRRDRDTVNAAATGPLPTLRLDADGLHRVGDLEAVLAALARDCLELHGSDDRHALRWCADERCTRPFVDRSHGGRRRWCGMKGCGDRAKAAAYRQRQRAAS